MRPENKNFIETNRDKLHGVLHLGRVRNLQLEAMRRVMVEEFNPRYGPVDESEYDQVAKLIKDLYTAYDSIQY